jgi:leucyl-tRNA synthetase
MSEYNPKNIEPKWQQYWDKNKTFKTGAPGAKKLYCLDMFPYPSGSGLHVGHPLGYTATDIYSRYKRMQGYSVLHPMGFDAFGLPAEQHAVATGEHPAVITKANCEKFTAQLKLVGLSYDWDRNLATCTPDYYKWTQWIFLKLFNSYFDEQENKSKPISELKIPEDIVKQGKLKIQEYQAEHRLAFYTDAMVNWCPALGTVLANEEVIDGKSERGGFDVVRKPMKQWMLRITKYAERLISELEDINWPESIKEQQRNWIGKKTGAEIRFKLNGLEEELRAFTTRPDTLFGVTFFVVSPEHPLVEKLIAPGFEDKVRDYCNQAMKLSDFDRTIESRKKTGVFTGSYVINPINNEPVPVYVGDYVLISVGTGAVMGVPAHDERDFEFARTFQIEIRPILCPENVDAELEKAVLEGEIAWTEAGTMLASKAKIFHELDLFGKTNKEASDKIIAWLEENNAGKRVVNYKLRDWLFSRQRYWGEPIPVVHWEDGSVTSLEESELPLILPEVKDFKPSESGESPLAKAKDWLVVEDPKTGLKGRRETNTMPQWAGSCWYYLRFIDPQNDKAAWDKKLEKAWMNVDLYVGGAEHAVLHLLYSRFWHKVLFDLGYVSTREPFQRLFNQGMVQANAYKDTRGALVPTDEVEDIEGQVPVRKATGEKLERIVAKMSKSLRNVVTLDEIIDQYGADTFRMYLMFMGPLDSSRGWDPKAISGNARFLRRAWTLITDNKDEGLREYAETSAESPKVKKAINKLIKKATEDMEVLSFNTSIAAMMEFLNEVSGEKLSKETVEKFIIILSPFAPHMAEELWNRAGHNKTVTYETWPVFDEKILAEENVSVVIQISGKKRALLDVSVKISENELRKCVIQHMSTTDYKVSEKDKFITIFRPGTKIPKLLNIIPQP